MNPIRNASQQNNWQASPTEPARPPLVIPGSVSSDSLREATSVIGSLAAHALPFLAVTGAIGYAGVETLMANRGAGGLTGVFICLPFLAGGTATALMKETTARYRRTDITHPVLRSLGDTITRVVAPTVLPVLALCSIGAPGFGLLAGLVCGGAACFFEGVRLEKLDKLLIEHRR